MGHEKEDERGDIKRIRDDSGSSEVRVRDPKTKREDGGGEKRIS